MFVYVYVEEKGKVYVCFTNPGKFNRYPNKNMLYLDISLITVLVLAPIMDSVRV